MERRGFVKALVSASVALLALPTSTLAALLNAAPWHKAAFGQKRLDSAFDQLGIINPTRSDQITLKAPDRAENGAIVQVEVKSALANTESIMLFVDKNPTALIATYQFAPTAVGAVITRIKMADTSDVIAVVKAGDQYYQQRKNVVVLESGCS